MEDIMMEGIMEKPCAIYTKHGAMKDAEPHFTPDARGLLIVVESRRKLNPKMGAAVNLHAQSLLRAKSPEFSQAQDWWQSLPHTPARRLFNVETSVSNILEAKAMYIQWAAQYDALPGLAYIFDAARMMNLKTGETVSELRTVITFGSKGMHMLKDAFPRDCVRYHLFFAYYEKPETLDEQIQSVSDSLTIVEKRELKC